MTRRIIVSGIALSLAACGGGDDGGTIVVDFGEPTIVVVVNPAINADNTAATPEPGVEFAGVDVELDAGPSGRTDDDGFVVLSPVPAGARSVLVTGDEIVGAVDVTMGARELREIAVAADAGGAAKMAEVDYDFTGTVVELTPDTPPGDIAAALAASDTIILFRGGTYVVGDVVLDGSDLTLFGEGAVSRAVVIEGNVTMRGSRNRIRGAIIDGALAIEGSDAGMSFSTVLGPTIVTGSGTQLLYNDLCGTITATGSGLTAVGNAGLAPIPAVCP